MFSIYKYELISGFRSKDVIFWLVAFPIILGTLFQFAFGNIEATDTGMYIPVAVISNQSSSLYEVFNETIDDLHQAGMVDPIFIDDFQYGYYLVTTGQIKGIFHVDETVNLYVLETGLQASILQIISDRFTQISSTLQNIAEINPTLMAQAVYELQNQLDINQQVHIGRSHITWVDGVLFITLGFSIMAGVNIGFNFSNYFKANTSALGVRRSVANNGFLLQIVQLFASITLSVIISITHYLYFMLVLRRNFGNQYGLILVTIIIGCITSVSLGSLVGSLVQKNNKETAAAIIQLIPVTLSALAGMMGGPVVRTTIENFVPFINVLNPVVLINDALIALVSFTNHDFFIQNIITLGALGTIFIIASSLLLRKTSYDSL